MIKSQRGIVWYVHIAYHNEEGHLNYSFYLIDAETEEEAIEIGKRLLPGDINHFPDGRITSAYPLAELLGEDRAKVRNLGPKFMT